MLRIIGRRLLFITVVSIFIIFMLHLGMRMAGNSQNRQPDYNVSQHGRLAWTDTKTYLINAWHGQWGTVQEEFGPVSVKAILQETYINSMGLLLAALSGAAILGLTFGAIAALTKHAQIVPLLLGLTILGISAPSFFAGLLLRQGEIYYLRTFGRALVSVAGFGWDYKHMLLPALVLAARPLAYITRATFIALSHVMTQSYIRTATAKGLSQPYTVNIHALPNIAVPLLTAVGVSLRFSLSTLPIVEFFFIWPGMGLRLLEAIDARQTQVVITLALALGLTFLFINLLLDVAYWLIDPRIRENA